MLFVKDQVCKYYQEDLRAEGKTTEDSYVLCQDENVYCRVGNHKTKDEKSSELFSLVSNLSSDFDEKSSELFLLVSKLSSDFDKAKPLLSNLSSDFDKAKPLLYKLSSDFDKAQHLF